jgi:hypothetical protein
VLTERPVPEEEDIVVREQVRTRRAVVLAVDVSGSMRGERIRTAAATVGALAGELRRDDLAVVAFWSDAAVLLRLGTPGAAAAAARRAARDPGPRADQLGFPLQVAARELARRSTRDARVVLLSDCVHNAGPDPRPFAARLPRLDVLLDTVGEHDLELGRELAAAGRGRLLRVRHHRDVAPALSRDVRGLRRDQEGRATMANPLVRDGRGGTAAGEEAAARVGLQGADRRLRARGHAAGQRRRVLRARPGPARGRTARRAGHVHHRAGAGTSRCR